MEDSVMLINNFSRKRLLRNFFPILIFAFVAGELVSAHFFFNLLIIIGIIAYVHPFFVDFKKEQQKYLEVLKEMIHDQVLVLKKCRDTEAIDLANYRNEFKRLHKSLHCALNDPVQYEEKYEEERQYFIRRLKNKMRNIYFESQQKKEIKIDSLNKKIKVFKKQQEYAIKPLII